MELCKSSYSGSNPLGASNNIMKINFTKETIMKTRTTIVVSLLSISVAFLSFVAPPALVKYKVDTSQSTLLWTGKKVTGQHHGTISIASGELTADGKVIREGTFDISIPSITVSDLTDPESNANLVKHLKSDDFFGAEKFPTANFTVLSITPASGNDYTVKGKLTIKGTSNDIEFPATIVTEGKSVIATAKITVDRSKYDIRYGSKTFFDNLGNKYIYDEFELDLRLVANQQTGS